MSTRDLQERMDRFYFERGACCAGCDRWGALNSVAGECTASAPVSGEQRYAMLGMSGSSLPLEAGHIFTKRDHVCGDFKDDFDWPSRPLAYLRRVGFNGKTVSS